MLNALVQKTNSVGDTMFVASRHVWLAGLGAAVVTRGWAEKEAGQMFRTLVKEGSAVESRAIRLVGDQVDASAARANVLWHKTRSTVGSAVRTYADTAVAIVRRTLPKTLPTVVLPSMLKTDVATRRKPAKARKAAKVVKARTAKPAKRAKRRTTR